MVLKSVMPDAGVKRSRWTVVKLFNLSPAWSVPENEIKPLAVRGPSQVPPLTVKLVVEAFIIVVLLETGLTVKYALELLSIICKALAVWLAIVLMVKVGLVVEAEPSLMYSAWLNSNLFDEVAEFQVKSALGSIWPRKKIKVSVSLSVEALSELMVKVADWVPPMVVEAAEILLAVKVLI